MKKLAFAVASALLTAPVLVHAENNPWDAQAGIQIGVFDADASTTVRLDSNSGRLGTEVSFEGTLGGEKKKTLPTLDFFWRFNPRHAIEGSYVSLRRDGDTAVHGSINWGDQTFPVNAPIHSKFETDTFRFAYRWSPVHDDTTELGLLLGLHYTNMKASITGSSGSGSATISQEASVKYPLPTIGARLSTRIAPSWRINGFGQILKIKIGDYDGELYNFGAGVEWGFTREMIAGLGYDYYKYALTSSKDRARGEFDYRFDGPKLYFSWNF